MTTRKKLGYLLLMATLAAAFALSVTPAFACSCIPPADPATEMARATAVFSSTVTAIDDSRGLISSSADPIPVTFAVSEVWKGDVSATTTVTTARDSASCGFNFTVGETYLVYAITGSNGLEVSLCSRTARLADASADLTALGAGKMPTAVPPTSATMPPPLILALGAGSLLLFAIFWTVAHHKPSHNNEQLMA